MYAIRSYYATGGIGRDAGYAAAGSIIAKADGIAAVNDLAAAGAGYAVSDAGLRVQEEIPLAGYDNMPFLTVLPFRLLTVDLKPAAIYRKAAEMLLSQIITGSRCPSETITPEILL